MPLPLFNSQGELPEGVHQATLDEVLERFIIFGTHVTNKPSPNDVDIFLVVAETFDVNNREEETRAVFAHAQAQSRFGASVF